jgi:hypothetical protein
MSEKQTAGYDLSLVDELVRITGPHFGEAAELATANDFRGLQMDVNEIVDLHPVPGDYRGIQNAHASAFLRRAGEPDTAPRFRFITDPSGNLDRKGNPTLVVHLEQGLPHADRPAKGKVGSWVMEVSASLGRQGWPVWVTVLGTQKTGRRSREALPGSSVDAKMGYKDYIAWMKRLVGEPGEFVVAPTELELRQPGLFARLGNMARSKS